MGTAYLQEVIRNKASYPGMLAGLKFISGKHTNTDSSTHTMTIETGCTYILFAHVQQYGGVVIACTVGSSTLYPGTKTVTYTILGSATAGGVSEYFIVGSSDVGNTSSSSGDETVIGFEH
jgi:hypothetical protein